MRHRVGVDTGGTFTDFVWLAGRTLTVHKRRSTPGDPSRAVLSGFDVLASAFARSTRANVVHGSTVATNAVLERRGARVGLVTTRGFEDVLRIGRQTRPELYNIFVPVPRPMVPAELTWGVSERMDASGRVLTPLDGGDLDALAAKVTAARVEIVAVCLLHAYANPVHEQEVAAHLRQAGLQVSASSEILPEYREFERWSTTAVNAYVTPVIDRCLTRLEEGAAEKGVGALSIMQSNGGSISARAARAQAVRTVLSGPAAGVVGARAVADAAGYPRVISFDMGGTSTDVSLVDGVIQTTTEARIADFPIRLPMIDIETVGAGGGSIAAIDEGGALRVGPRSAGADPGPACYGRGLDLTVTDANLLLGRLDPALFFDGGMTLDVRRAADAARPVAARLKLSVERLAEGVIRVANANMDRAIRAVSLGRGHDPREFALLAFGGAGGMHACELADRLDIATVIVPRHAGVLSALGMLVADVVRDYSAPILKLASDVSSQDIAARIAVLVDRARGELALEGFEHRRQRMQPALDLRYAGQSSELTVPFTRNYRREFDRLHFRRYGYADTSRPAEIVSARVVAAGLTDKPKLPFRQPRPAFTPKATAVEDAWFGGRRQRLHSYRWADLGEGARAAGPALITSGDATVVVPPGFGFRVDGFGNVIATRASRRGARRRRSA